ncbi:MAG: AEC family transporter [Sphingobium sp.]|nr:AEC family transporter [Sphingobium sp.]
MFSNFISILPVFIVILTGYVAARLKIVPATASNDLNRFVLWIALPAMLFHIVATTDWANMWDGDFVIASLLGSLITFGAGALIGRFRGVSLADSAIDGLSTGFANTAYIGLPLFLLALGPVSTPYVVIGATVTLTALSTCAIVMIEWASHRHLGAGVALSKASVGVIRNPVVLAPLLGMIWWMTGWPLPDVVERSTDLLGMAASPTALVAIGLFLADRPLIESLTSRAALGLSATKLFLHPIITAIIVWPILGMGQFTGVMAIAIAALPTGTGPFMIAAYYGRDNRVASGAVLISTLFSAISISAILSLLPH